MSKLCLVLLIATLAVVTIEARRCTRCGIKDIGNPREICVRQASTNTCQRVATCVLQEQNCVRRGSGKELLQQTCSTQCRKIPRGSNSRRRCAPKKVLAVAKD